MNIDELIALETKLQGRAVAPVNAVEAQPQPEAPAVPRWWTCATHGDAMPHNAWGCPECVREQREQIKSHDAQMMRAIAALNEARAAQRSRTLLSR